MDRRTIALVSALAAVAIVAVVREQLGKRRVAATYKETVGSLDLDHVRDLRVAVEHGYDSTIAAFATSGDDAQYEARDARAEADAQQLRETFERLRAQLAPELAIACEALVERVSGAQMKLMAFAINRKNRGLPDGAQVEAEASDRKAFRQEIEPIYAHLKTVLHA